MLPTDREKEIQKIGDGSSKVEVLGRKWGLPESHTEKQMIELDVLSLSTGDLPKTHTEYCEHVWKAFNLGKRYKELEMHKNKE